MIAKRRRKARFVSTITRVARLARTAQDADRQRPWPSAEFRREVIDQIAQIEGLLIGSESARTPQLTSAAVRDLLCVQVDGGPAAVMTLNEHDEALARAGTTPLPSSKDPHRQLKIEDVAVLLQRAVPVDLYSSELLERLGKIVYVEAGRDGRDRFYIVLAADGVLLLVLPTQPAGIRALRIGVMIDGNVYPAQSAYVQGHCVPAFDDADVIAKGSRKAGAA